MDETEINYNDFLLLQDSIDSIEINNILQSIGSNVNISQSDSQAEFTNGFSQITVDSNPVSSVSFICFCLLMLKRIQIFHHFYNYLAFITSYFLQFVR